MSHVDPLYRSTYSSDAAVKALNEQNLFYPTLTEEEKKAEDTDQLESKQRALFKHIYSA